MTLDEAIQHCEEVAQENEKQFDGCPMKYEGAYANNGKTARKCAKEHRQLAEWLKDYKRQTDVLDKIKADIEQLTSRYTISRERGGMGQVEWSGRLIKESEVMQIIDKHKVESEEA